MYAHTHVIYVNAYTHDHVGVTKNVHASRRLNSSIVKNILKFYCIVNTFDSLISTPIRFLLTRICIYLYNTNKRRIQECK